MIAINDTKLKHQSLGSVRTRTRVCMCEKCACVHVCCVVGVHVLACCTAGGVHPQPVSV